MIDDNIPSSEPKPTFTPGTIQTFSCPNCGGSVGIRASGISISAVCQNCGSIIDISNENYKVIEKAAVRIVQSRIPLGARAVLFGTEWETIGYCIRSDITRVYKWREYLLFNPYQGFRFLVEADDHWNFVKMMRCDVEVNNASKLKFDGRKYQLYSKEQAVVLYAMGEFYWRMQVGEETFVEDYIAPPYMLSMERSLSDEIWSHAVYVPNEEIGKAFGLQTLPKHTGVSPNQPGPYQGKIGGIIFTGILFFLLLITMQFISAQNAADQVVYHRKVEAPATYKGQLLISDPIELTGSKSNVVISVTSSVDNNWAELDLTLANAATQETEDGTVTTEYYHGYDADGSWSEGDRTAEIIFSAVPAGKYYLQVEPDAGAFTQGNPVTFDIVVARDKPVWSNFWITLGLLLFYPLWVRARHKYFETKRWSNSFYAPAKYRSGDE